MLSLWVCAAMLAGLLQALRSAMQQNHRKLLTVNGAAMVRHLFGLPFVLIVAIGYLKLRGLAFGWPTSSFLGYVFLASILQIFGTLALIHSFTDRGYLVGSAFSKTEALQAGAAAAIINGERLGAVAWLGLAVGFGGVMLLASQGRKLSLSDFAMSIRQPAAGYGITAAGLLAATGLAGKAATEQIPLGDPLASALLTVSAVMIMQCLMQGIWMLRYDTAGLEAVLSGWRASIRIGLVSGTASTCWFAAIAIAPVALVRIIGQTEVIFTMWLARAYLKELPSKVEISGLLLVAGGVILSLLGLSLP